MLDRLEKWEMKEEERTPPPFAFFCFFPFKSEMAGCSQHGSKKEREEWTGNGFVGIELNSSLIAKIERIKNEQAGPKKQANERER
jgi:RNA polymerase subunit RPABC4/transcription elongation factor Spt4